MDRKIVFIYFDDVVPEYFDNYYNIFTKCIDFRNTGGIDDIYKNNSINLDIKFYKYDSDEILKNNDNNFYILNIDEQHNKLNRTCKLDDFYKKLDNYVNCSKSNFNNIAILVKENLKFETNYNKINKIAYRSKTNNYYGDMIYIMKRFLENYYKTDEKYTVFLSHTKNDNEVIVEKICNELEKLKLDTFFDVKSIDKSIRDDIDTAIKEENAGMIVLTSVSYSSRPWCVYEISKARNINMPVVLLDLVDHGNERILQHTANYKMFSSKTKETTKKENIDEKEMTNVVFNAVAYLIFQSIVKEYLKYKTNDYINVTSIPWQPTAIDIIDNKSIKFDEDKKTIETLIYPEPVMLHVEKNIIATALTEYTGDTFIVKTLLEYESDKSKKSKEGEDNNNKNCKRKVVQISSSIPEDINDYGYIMQNYLDFIGTLIRYLLYFDQSIAYMGLFDKNIKYNITNIIIEYVKSYIEEYKFKNDVPLTERVLYLNEMNIQEQYSDEIENNLGSNYIVIDVDCSDVEESEISPRIKHTRHIEELLNNDAILIVVGGQYTNEKFSGVINEILLYVEKEKPIYIIGNFGGVAKAFGQYLLNKDDSDITKYFGDENDENYKNWKEYNLEQINKFKNLLSDKSIKEILNNGLSDDLNKCLMDTETSFYEKIKIILGGIC